MDNCRGCGIEHISGLCKSCKVVVPAIAGKLGIRIEDGPEVDDLRTLLGGPEPTPSQVWRGMSRASSSGIHDNREMWWALATPQQVDERQWICAPPPPWDPTDAEIDVFDSGESVDCLSGRSAVRRASRGGLLPDGSYLSWTARDEFSIDGRPIKLPYRGLLEILRKHKDRDRYDWKRLLISIDIALSKTWIGPQFPDGFHIGARRNGALIIHPAYQALNPTEYRRNPTRFRRARESTAFYRELLEEATWMRRWEVEVADHISNPTFQELCSKVPTSLWISRGRLQLRVRRPSGWKKVFVPNDPDLWAWLVTWALSPPNHSSYRSLLALQQHLFADDPLSDVSKEDGRGLVFLREIVNGNRRVTANPELSLFRVKGTSGMSYLVTPEDGPHGTRFSVSPADRADPEETNPRFRHHIARMSSRLCIVETPEMRRLVIGDAIGGIIMALLDDLSSRQNIDTLDNYLVMTYDRPRRIRELDVNANPNELQQFMNLAREQRYYGGELGNNDLEERRRRCTESFPRLWSALLRMPLGSRATFTAMRGRGEPNITFDDCDTAFSTSGWDDRTAVYMMLQASGWQRDFEEERVRGSVRIYFRAGLGRRELHTEVVAFSGVLEERLVMVDGEGQIRPIDGPLWNHFERYNPGVADLLPDTDGNIR